MKGRRRTAHDDEVVFRSHIANGIFLSFEEVYLGKLELGRGYRGSSLAKRVGRIGNGQGVGCVLDVERVKVFCEG